jgi:hypothetical protein
MGKSRGRSGGKLKISRFTIDSEDDESEPPPEEKGATKAATKPCPKCGGETELLDLEVRSYLQCLKDKTHRHRVS